MTRRRPTTSRSIERSERVAQAVELRKAGATYNQIGQTLECDPTTVSRMIATHMKQLNEPVEELRALELERLDALQMPAWKQAREGNLRAIETVLRIMERRAKLLGLDDYERRIADAAEATTQGAVDAAMSIIRVVDQLVDRLQLTIEQRRAAPGILLELLQAADLLPPDIIPAEATEENE